MRTQNNLWVISKRMGNTSYPPDLEMSQYFPLLNELPRSLLRGSSFGLRDLVKVEERLALDICRELGGIEGSPEPVHKWLGHRYEALSAKPIFEGRMMDTVEIAARWTALPEIYEGISNGVRAVDPKIDFGAGRPSDF